MCIAAIISTVIAWFLGLILDANIGFEPQGFLCLRILLPIIVMGAFVLRSNGQKADKR